MDYNELLKMGEECIKQNLSTNECAKKYNITDENEILFLKSIIEEEGGGGGNTKEEEPTSFVVDDNANITTKKVVQVLPELVLLYNYVTKATVNGTPLISVFFDVDPQTITFSDFLNMSAISFWKYFAGIDTAILLNVDGTVQPFTVTRYKPRWVKNNAKEK